MSPSASEEARLFLEQHPDLSSIDLLISDLNGTLRGKRVGRGLLMKVFEQGFALPRSVMGLDATGDTVPETDLGLETGDSDNLCLPIPGTLSIQPWCKDELRGQLLCTMVNPDGSAFFADPRQALARVIERFDGLGYTPGIALELEFYLFDSQRGPAGELQQPRSAGNGRRMTSTQVYAIDDLDDYDAFIRDVLESARRQGLPADTVIAENAPGQFEVNLDYGNDILAACDQAVLLKRVIKSVAKNHDYEASFMAKPYIEEPGNGLHIHLSLMDQQGDNIFAAGNAVENPNMRAAMAGLIDTAKASQGLICPNVNSFRRLAPGLCAPTSICWGFDNRSVSLRIPAGAGKATRIESRAAGADANPYLATAAMLIGVAEGLHNQMTPPPPVTGNAYDQDHPMLADNQRDALRAMAADERIGDWLGHDFIEVYSVTRWHDLQLFERQVTDLELELLLPYM